MSWKNPFFSPRKPDAIPDPVASPDTLSQLAQAAVSFIERSPVCGQDVNLLGAPHTTDDVIPGVWNDIVGSGSFHPLASFTTRYAARDTITPGRQFVDVRYLAAVEHDGTVDRQAIRIDYGARTYAQDGMTSVAGELRSVIMQSEFPGAVVQTHRQWRSGGKLEDSKRTHELTERGAQLIIGDLTGGELLCTDSEIRRHL